MTHQKAWFVRIGATLVKKSWLVDLLFCTSEARAKPAIPQFYLYDVRRLNPHAVTSIR